MKRFRISILILMLAGMVLVVQAQHTTIRQLQVGDPMPEMELRGLLNYPTASVNLSDLKGKAIILDFCNTSCSYCTENMPKLMALKKQFEGKLEIFRVTRNTKKQVEALYQRSEIAAQSKLPIAVSDTTLIKLFPVKAPHHAWIDANGAIRAITNPRNTELENITSLVRGGEINVTPAAYFESFDARKPLYREEKINLNEHIKQYSMITGYINGIEAKIGYSIDSLSNAVTRRAYYNMPLRLLLKMAYAGGEENKFGIPSDNRKIILEVKDTSRFVPPRQPSLIVPWEWQNTWCYEVQAVNESKLPLLMQSDLNRYFNLDVSVEKRKVQGLALVKIGTVDSLLSKGVDRLSTFNTVTRKVSSYNVSAGQLAKTLTSMLVPLVVDQTGITGCIDFQILKSNDLREVRKALHQYGLDLIEKRVETEMLVIRDKN